MLQEGKKKIYNLNALREFKVHISEGMLVQSVRVYWTDAHFFLPNGDYEMENKY